MKTASQLFKVAKDLQATMVYQHMAKDYLTKAGYTSELAVQQKDIQRVKDMNTKSHGDEGKYFSLVNQMANSIKDAEKAYRRGVAILQYADLKSDAKKQQFASVFFEKAISLG